MADSEVLVNQKSLGLARRGLLYSLGLAWIGAFMGVIGSRYGTVVGLELDLVYVSLLFSTVALATFFFFRKVPLQAIATASTVFFILNLSAGMVIAVCGSGWHLSVMVYLLWFFPLLVFNKMVNRRAVGLFLANFLMTAPLLLVCVLMPQMAGELGSAELILVIVDCIAYVCFVLMMNVVTRYREEYIVERERGEKLRAEVELLESLSDCYLSLDTERRLVYLNNAACIEFGIDQTPGLGKTLPDAAPAFFSLEMFLEFQLAWNSPVASTFEAQNRELDKWYAVRCYPRTNGMSVHFRNITEEVEARGKLHEAHTALRDQATLLDKATDAIYVLDMELRVRYWNQGAERMYGMLSEAVVGQFLQDIFQYDQASVEKMNERYVALLEDGEWTGEVRQRHGDGRVVISESRSTLVRDEVGNPRSILAINTDITKRKAADERIQHLAYYDSLTGLPNRARLKELLEKALMRAESEGTKGAVMFIDLDDFKTLNDTQGHDMGDQLLQQVAKRLAGCVREIDTLARLGGDEFVVMLEALSGDAALAARTTEIVGKSVLKALKAPYRLGSHEGVVQESVITSSIGMTLFPEPRDTTKEVLKRADLAMYRAKEQGRNSMCFFDEPMLRTVAARAALQADLRHAIGRGELELHYQPQVDRQGQVKSCEALLRWQHPVRGKVPPNEFIPLAEEAGLIFELGRWVLETACRQLAAWETDPLMTGLHIAVNVSVRQFLDVNFVETVRSVLRETGADPGKLKLEMTESSMMEQVQETIAKMDQLKRVGISFSLDDFGTGYSSLSHLRQLPLEQLKIDRSFVCNVVTDPKDAAIAGMIIAMGQNLDFSVIAEGVETEEQREFLEKEGCHTYQGFLYSPALPVAEFEEFVARQRIMAE